MPLTPSNPVGVAVRRPHVRSRASLWLFAFTAAVGFLLVNVVDPYSGAMAATTSGFGESRFGSQPIQQLTVAGSYTNTVTRDAVSVIDPPKPVVTPQPSTSSSSSSSAAPAAGKPDPGTAKAIGYQAVHARGWGDDQYNCLVALWNRESGWNVYAHNGSGAYGIPQALPGSKMASAGPNWQSDPATQIAWGLGYITGRYGTPCGAWNHSQSSGWY